MSLEQDLLDAADAFEKTASEIETQTTSETTTETTEVPTAVATETTTEKTASDTAIAENAKVLTEQLASSEKVAAIKEELGIQDDTLAEKIASADPTVLAHIQNLSQESVESMGGEDLREKTASIDEDECPLGSFMSTP